VKLSIKYNLNDTYLKEYPIRNTSLRICNTLALPYLFYGSEMWKIKAKDNPEELWNEWRHSGDRICTEHIFNYAFATMKQCRQTDRQTAQIIVEVQTKRNKKLMTTVEESLIWKVNSSISNIQITDILYWL